MCVCLCVHACFASYMYQVCVYACFFIQGKIEVKILTRKNAEEAGDQWLTEEDTKSFRELLISLLVTKL